MSALSGTMTPIPTRVVVSLAEAARLIGRTPSALKYRIEKGDLRAQVTPLGRACTRVCVDVEEARALHWTARAPSLDPDGAHRRKREPDVPHVVVPPRPSRMPDLDAGACRTEPDVPDFFADSNNTSAIATAKAMCETCPLLETCRAWALHNEPYGVWGGLSERERRVVRRRAGLKGWME
jgi:WhiB family transcriptional regulator, redox-sensing transcriptional regulator